MTRERHDELLAGRVLADLDPEEERELDAILGRRMPAAPGAADTGTSARGKLAAGLARLEHAAAAAALALHDDEAPMPAALRARLSALGRALESRGT